jgi:hypothetical protein
MDLCCGGTYIVLNNIFYNLNTGYDNMPAGAQLRNNIFYSIDELYDDDKGPPDESGTITEDPNLVSPSMSNRAAVDAQI